MSGKVLSFKEIDIAANVYVPESKLYGQPDNYVTKYRETYYQLGELLRDHPQILGNLRVAGLGSTRPFHSISTIALGVASNKILQKSNLNRYYNFELGYGKGSETLFELTHKAVPKWNSKNLPIECVQGNIFNWKHYPVEATANINLFDFDSTLSFTGKQGQELMESLPAVLSVNADNLAALHLNMVVRNFRVRSNYTDFTSNIIQLLNNIRKDFKIEKIKFTQYQTRKSSSITDMGGFIAVIKRRDNV